MKTPVAKKAGSRECPACGGTTSRGYGEKNGHTIRKCSACSTLFAIDVDFGGLATFYDDYYSPKNLTIPEFVQRRLEEIVATFAPYKKNGRLLDVGSGGGFLPVTAKKMGWDAWATEVSISSVEHLRTLGLNVAHGLLEDAGFPDDHFDVVVATEVLEHVPFPQKLAAECARVLRPGGLFYATMPHGRGISARMMRTGWSVLCPPEHAQLLSTKGTRKLLRASGFREKRIAREAVNPFELLAFLRHGAAATTEAPSPLTGANPSQPADLGNYAVNEALLRSPLRRAFRSAANAVLDVTSLGDSLKIWATKD